jgi:hypothetical protein
MKQAESAILVGHIYTHHSPVKFAIRLDVQCLKPVIFISISVKFILRVAMIVSRCAMPDAEKTKSRPRQEASDIKWRKHEAVIRGCMPTLQLCVNSQSPQARVSKALLLLTRPQLDTAV